MQFIQILTMFLSAIASVLAGIVTLLSVLNGNKIKEVHLTMNSRLDQLLTVSVDAAHARGIQEERNSGCKS